MNTGWERENRTHNDGNETYDEIQAVYEKYYYSHYKSDQRPVKISEMKYEDFLKPAEIHRGFRFESLEQYGFNDIVMKLYNASRTFGADEYIAFLDTMSDHRAMPEENRKALYAGIKEVILKHSGQLKMDFIFQLYMGGSHEKTFYHPYCRRVGRGYVHIGTNSGTGTWL